LATSADFNLAMDNPATRCLADHENLRVLVELDDRART
jgi:hypothetical protein